MAKSGTNSKIMEEISYLINEGKIDDVVEVIANYLNLSTDENYIDRLENVIETVCLQHGGRTVIRFLIENNIVDIPGLLENLSKKDSLLRYSFLLLLKDISENEGDLFLPYCESLLNSDDPNVREADLQLLIFMAGGEKKIEEESLIKTIASKLADEKEYVAEKAVQALKAFGKRSPSLVTRSIVNFGKEFPENEELKKNIDNILKSIVTAESIEEFVEDEETKFEEIKDDLSEDIDKKEIEIFDKELELKKIEIEKKKLELEEKRFNEIADVPKEIITEELKKEESKILDKEIELKKKNLEIKKKKIELEEKEKDLQEREIQEKTRSLILKEELLEKETELSRVELELKKKNIEEKKQQILASEAKRAQELEKEDG